MPIVGTIMSYCHLVPGGSVTNIFHNTVKTQIRGASDAAACMQTAPAFGACCFGTTCSPWLSAQACAEGGGTYKG